MGFLVAALPWLIPSAASAAVGIHGTRSAGKRHEQSLRASQMTDSEREAQALQLELAKTGKAREAELYPQYQEWLERSKGAFAPALSYFSKLASGDPRLMLQAMAPEMEAAQQQQRQARNALSQFYPQAGGTQQALAQATMDNSPLHQAMFGLRPAAASQMANLGATQAEIAQGIGSAGASYLSGSSVPANSLLKYGLGQQQNQLQRDQLDWDRQRGLGQGLFSLGKYIWPKIQDWYADRNKGATASSPPWAVDWNKPLGQDAYNPTEINTPTWNSETGRFESGLKKFGI